MTDIAGVSTSNSVEFAECCQHGVDTADEELKKACALVQNNIVELSYSTSSGCLTLVRGPNGGFLTEFYVGAQRCCDEGTTSQDQQLIAACAAPTYSIGTAGECIKTEAGVDQEVDDTECCEAGELDNDSDLMTACPAEPTT